ncbi:MAG: 3-hydroxyacyl-ACP dehydratase FabZ family protein [Chitinophagales bacterium]
MDLLQRIKELLPYEPPFLFVDELTEINENGAKGTYTFRKDEYFYRGHLPNNPITPGVILIETMAQIGLVTLGMFLIKAHENLQLIDFAFSSSEVEFLKMVRPEEKVWVQSEKVYFRFGKLKCRVVMTNEAGEKVCKGHLSGMVLRK